MKPFNIQNVHGPEIVHRYSMAGFVCVYARVSLPSTSDRCLRCVTPSLPRRQLSKEGSVRIFHDV